MPGPAPAPSIRVLLVAMPLVGWGLERLLRDAHPRYELVGSAADMPAGVAALERQKADVVVLLAGDGVSTVDIANFCTRCGSRVLMVTGSTDEDWLDSIVMSGVRGIVRTRDTPHALLRAIEKLHEGELWIDRAATSRIFMEIARQKALELNDPERAKIATLTARERQMVVALANDASASGKVLASRLCISEHTVRNHLSAIYNKLGLDNKRDLYAFARRYRLHE